MRQSVNGDRLQRRIRENDFLVTGGCRVTFESGIDVRPKHTAHRWQLLEKILQYFLGFRFRCFIWRKFAEASANFSFKSRVQMSDANARGISKVFRANERFTAKTGEHQAHQLGASGFDRETRGEGSCRSEII